MVIIVVEVNFENCANPTLALIGHSVPQLFFNDATPLIAANKYIRSMARRLAPKSIKTLVEHIKELHIWMDASRLSLEVFTSDTFDAYIDALCIYTKKNNEPLSWNTVNARAAGAYRYLVWCSEQALCPLLTCLGIKNSYKSTRNRYKVRGHPAKSFKELTRFLQLHDAVKFIEQLGAVTGQSKKTLTRRNKLIGSLMLQSGLRISEVTGFQLNDLPEVNIRGHSTPARVIGKGNKARVILIPNNLLVKLWQYVDIDRENLIDTFIGGGRNPDFLFLSDNARGITPNWIEKLFSKASATLGIKTTPHTLRHTYGTYHYLLNKDLAGLANLMGHASEETTRSYYVHTAVLISYAGSYSALQDEVDKLIEV